MRNFAGRVLDNTRVYILNEQLEIISDGHQGEICIAGISLALGNITMENDEIKRHTFVKNPHGIREGNFKPPNFPYHFNNF